MPCPICRDGPMRPGGEFPVQVCDSCDQRALNANGETPWRGYPPEKQAAMDESPAVEPPDDGENPVFIDGNKCWRRYRFGGWITFLDYYDCDTLDEFYVRHGLLPPRSPRQQHTVAEEPMQHADPNSSSTDSNDNTRSANRTSADSRLDHSTQDREKLGGLLLQGVQGGSTAELPDSEPQQIATLIGESQLSSLAIKYLAMLATDDPETALEALPTVASAYSQANTETQQWSMYYFSCISMTYPDALFPILDTLIAGVTSEKTKIQLNSLAALGHIVSSYPNVGSGLVDEIAALLAHSHATVRKNAVGLLGDIAQEYQRHVVVHTPTIAACLTDEDAQVRRNAAIALVRSGEADPHAIREQSNLLEHALRDGVPEVRKSACILIGNAEPSISTSELERLAETDPDPKVKEMAQWALSEITS